MDPNEFAAYHIERSIANRLGLPEYSCACNRCKGALIKKVTTVARHHIIHGRDPYLVYPIMVSYLNRNSLVIDKIDCETSPTCPSKVECQKIFTCT